MEILTSELNPNIFVISEHGFDSVFTNYFKLNNYKLVDIYCRENSKFGGVAIFADLNVNCEKIIFNLNKEKDFEISAAKFTFKSNSIATHFVVIGLYRSPGGDLKVFFEKLEMLLILVTNKNTQFVILGDFNIDILKTDNIHVKKLRDILLTFNLEWKLNSPTRVTASSSTAIDNIITNIKNPIHIQIIH